MEFNFISKTIIYDDNDQTKELVLVHTEPIAETIEENVIDNIMENIANGVKNKADLVGNVINILDEFNINIWEV